MLQLNKIKIMNYKNRFKVGDDIRQFRYDETIRIGTVTKGPMRVEGVDHYHVNWTWEHKDYGTPEAFQRDQDLISDMTSTKYHYN